MRSRIVSSQLEQSFVRIPEGASITLLKVLTGLLDMEGALARIVKDVHGELMVEHGFLQW
jgi:hypothetical protein